MRRAFAAILPVLALVLAACSSGREERAAANLNVDGSSGLVVDGRIVAVSLDAIAEDDHGVLTLTITNHHGFEIYLPVSGYYDASFATNGGVSKNLPVAAPREAPAEWLAVMSGQTVRYPVDPAWVFRGKAPEFHHLTELVIQGLYTPFDFDDPRHREVLRGPLRPFYLRFARDEKPVVVTDAP